MESASATAVDVLRAGNSLSRLQGHMEEVRLWGSPGFLGPSLKDSALGGRAPPAALAGCALGSGPTSQAHRLLLRFQKSERPGKPEIGTARGDLP